MSEQQERARWEHELSPLTDSLTSCIRWRLSDYEAMLRGEVELLLAAPRNNAAGVERRAR